MCSPPQVAWRCTCSREPHPSYSPISLIEVHGVVDAIIPYGTSYSSSLYFDGSLDGEEGAIQNIVDWAAMNE